MSVFNTLSEPLPAEVKVQVDKVFKSYILAGDCPGFGVVANLTKSSPELAGLEANKVHTYLRHRCQANKDEKKPGKGRKK